MKHKIKFLFAGIIASLSALAQQNPSPFSFRVLGNCGMCEKTIEKAALKHGASKAEWDKTTKVLTVKYNAKKVSAEEILKGVAYAGYDNEKFLAPDEAYNNLHECCKYERPKAKQSENTQPARKQETETNAKTETLQKANELTRVYDLYFSLKDELVKNDSKQASVKGKELNEALGAVKMEKLGDKEHTVFMKQLSGLKSDAGKISGSTDISNQRDRFSALSEKMYELMKAIKPAYPVYLTHCAMYSDGKGANWLSKESAVKNPYYGSQMLTCGKVKEVLK